MEAGELLSPEPGKALVASTYVRNDNGRLNIEEIQIGDTVYNSRGEKTKVINKYNPGVQDKFELTIKEDDSNRIEKFISGSEHMWTVQIKNISGKNYEKVVNTQELYNLKNDKNIDKLKFKKIENFK